jgi:Inhibitor of Apoptosis domain
MSFLKPFSNPATRLETYKYFPKSRLIVDELVDCGFFLEIDNHTATCFNCGSSFDLQNISSQTDFNAIHIKLNSNCSFIHASCSQRDAKKIASRVKYLKPPIYYKRQQASFNEDYNDCYDRLKSLPASVTNKKKIARAGFYRASKRYVCFECGVCVRLFHGDPWKIHAKLNPQCAHLITNRGFFYIQANQ